MQVHNAHGESLHVSLDGTERTARPDAGRDDTIVISYRGKSHSIGLAKRISPWVLLDLLSYGPGFVIDDVSRWWYSYMPVYVHVDSAASDFSLASYNWLGEAAGSTRPSLLLLGGLGMAIHVGPPLPDIAVLLGPQFQFFLKFQGGVGVDFNKAVEVFYLGQDEPEFDLTPGKSILGINFGDQTEITTQSIAARVFLPKTNFFLQSSFGWGHGETDTIGTDPSNKYRFYRLYSNSFPVIGAGIGWAGDISYVALQYAVATRRFSIDGHDDELFHSIFLDFGLNLRF